MKRMARVLDWQKLSLPGQFLLAGGFVMLLAMTLVGNWVAERIEDSVVQNSGISAALFMESFISPLSQELGETDTLSPPARQALAEIFDGTSLGERVLSYKIWLPGGFIVHASDPALIGQTFAPSDDLIRAWDGHVAASFEDLNDIEDATEAALGVSILEVYSPIRQAWTGEIIAVAEFYETADQLANDISNARKNSWLVVAAAFLGSGLLLFGIVQAGGRTIARQRERLKAQLEQTEAMSLQNAGLRQRSVAASARAVAQTEQAIRRIGSDLHDGPGQYLSLASLRLDSALSDPAKAKDDVSLVRASLDKALDELRIISRGLALPDLDTLKVEALIDRAAQDHARQTGLEIITDVADRLDAPFNYAQKLCMFRFLQEALSNASRHAKVESVTVAARMHPDHLTLRVADSGIGFHASQPRKLRTDGGQGLLGLTDRAESIGGTLDITSKPGTGTTLTLTLPFDETSP